MATTSLQKPPQKPEPKSDTMGRCIILKEDVDPSTIEKSSLTTDCYFIHREGGKIDVARGSAVHIFDAYYDKGIKLTQIEMSGGNLNPKLHTPEL